MESTTEPLLVRADEAARLCGASARTWRTWDAGGLVPRGVKVGRARFWRTAELAAWVAASCPTRREWDLRREDSD